MPTKVDKEAEWINRVTLQKVCDGDLGNHGNSNIPDQGILFLSTGPFDTWTCEEAEVHAWPQMVSGPNVKLEDLQDHSTYPHQTGGGQNSSGPANGNYARLEPNPFDTGPPAGGRVPSNGSRNGGGPGGGSPGGGPPSNGLPSPSSPGKNSSGPVNGNYARLEPNPFDTGPPAGGRVPSNGSRNGGGPGGGSPSNGPLSPSSPGNGPLRPGGGGSLGSGPPGGRGPPGPQMFSELEDWLMSICIFFAVAQYGGKGRDQEKVLILMDFIKDEALKWYLQHVIHVNRNQLQWSFTDVVMGLYDCFVQPSTMQDACEAFHKAAYIAEDGVQGYYDSLLNHAQNMAVYPDEYTIREKFLDGNPSNMLIALICDGGLSPEVNTVEDFVSEVKAYETSLKTATHLAAEDKECLVTWVTVNGQQAWTLWDSGSTTSGLTTVFAHVAGLRVSPLENPIVLQLGTIGSHSVVNFGAEVPMQVPGFEGKVYVDIANFDRYDLIIGTPFMRQGKVHLDFENNLVVVNGVPHQAKQVRLEEGDGQLHWFRTVEG
ncbi:hypothetical protein DXG01_011637 [Tephrocybe rancida]|nr:hypothetical protein DXG01_011637 [Tephrocybe rancida]